MKRCSHWSPLIVLALFAACGGGGNTGVEGDARRQILDGATADATASNNDFAGPGSSTTITTGVTIPLPGNRSVAATVCAPTTGADRPLVIISPGFAQALEQYGSYCEHLASWGYPTVIAGYTGFPPDHSQAADDRAAIVDWAATEPTLSAWDGTRVALAGHSLGGKVSILAATRDSRIDLVIGWDPVDAGTPSVAPELVGDLSAPLVLLGETLDGAAGTGIGAQACAPSTDNYTQYYAAAPSPAVELTVVGADHMDWVDDGACFTCTFCQTGTADREVVRSTTRRTMVAALRFYLEADAEAASFLTGAAIAADVAAGLVTQRAK